MSRLSDKPRRSRGGGGGDYLLYTPVFWHRDLSGSQISADVSQTNLTPITNEAFLEGMISLCGEYVCLLPESSQKIDITLISVRHQRSRS